MTEGRPLGTTVGARVEGAVGVVGEAVTGMQVPKVHVEQLTGRGQNTDP